MGDTYSFSSSGGSKCRRIS